MSVLVIILKALILIRWSNKKNHLGIVEDDDEAGVDEEEAEVAIDDEVLLMDGDI